VAFRITPDVTRQSGLIKSRLAQQHLERQVLVFRIKYGSRRSISDDWMTKGSWTRFGIQQTPLLDYEEGIYRYRFQGTTLHRARGFLQFGGRGRVVPLQPAVELRRRPTSGSTNGEGYAKKRIRNGSESCRNPRHAPPVRAQHADSPGHSRDRFLLRRQLHQEALERTRAVGQLTFEYKYINAGYDYIKAHDQTAFAAPDVAASGWSFWATPKKPFDNGSSVEVLLRYDHLQPNTVVRPTVRRTIAGLAYCFPHQGAVSTARMLDYDGQTFNTSRPAQPAQKRIAVHGPSSILGHNLFSPVSRCWLRTGRAENTDPRRGRDVSRSDLPEVDCRGTTSCTQRRNQLSVAGSGPHPPAHGADRVLRRVGRSR